MLDGTPDADTINGQGGNDTISRLDGNDTINDGLGNDTLRGDLGADALDGGEGNESADYFTSGSGINVNLLTALLPSQGLIAESIENLQAFKADREFAHDGSI